MEFHFVATKGESLLRYNHTEREWGNHSDLEIRTNGETPTLSYDFDSKVVKMSSGSYTPELPNLISFILGLVELENDVTMIKDSIKFRDWYIINWE